MPRDLDAKPTAESIRELHTWIEDGRSGWPTQRALDAKLKPLIRLDHTVLVSDTDNPERKNRLKPERMDLGEGPRTIQVISSLFNVPPRIGVMFIGEGSRVPAKAEQAEIALAELADQLNPPTDSPWQRGVDEMIALGRMVLMALPGDAWWWDAPKKGSGELDSVFMERYKVWQRKAPVPILFRNLPAESTFPPSLGALNDLALCTLKTSWHELRDIFSEQELADVLPEDKDQFGDTTLVIFANRAWVAYAVLADEKSGVPGMGRGFKDKIIRSIEHKLNKCPIRILPGKTGPKEPGQFWRSVLHNVISMIPQLDARASAAATASLITCLARLSRTQTRRGIATWVTS